jgi:uncharacterized protein YicC (UPF0701 family)
MNYGKVYGRTNLDQSEPDYYNPFYLRSLEAEAGTRSSSMKESLVSGVSAELQQLLRARASVDPKMQATLDARIKGLQDYLKQISSATPESVFGKNMPAQAGAIRSRMA